MLLRVWLIRFGGRAPPRCGGWPCAVCIFCERRGSACQIARTRSGLSETGRRGGPSTWTVTNDRNGTLATSPVRVGGPLMSITLSGIVLPDARSGRLVNLGEEPDLGILTLIRHRY